MAAVGLGITELLETILLQLSPSEVIRARRVHNAWKDTILGSPKLRQLIFIDPKSNLEVLVWDKDNRGNKKPRIITKSSNCHVKRSALVIASIHPAIANMSFGKQPQYSKNAFNGEDPLMTATIVNINYKELMQWQPGDWHDMLVTNPPCRVSECSGLPTHLERDSCHSFLTLGMLVKAFSYDPSGCRVYLEISNYLADTCRWVREARDRSAAEAIISS